MPNPLPKKTKVIYSNTSPRGYLSWSQLSLWEKDPNLYYQVYIEGLDQFRTPYLELGKRMATALENGHDDFNDPVFNMIAVFMPHYPKREFDIKETFEGIPLFGKLDGFDPAYRVIGEYKSGKSWTQSQVDRYGQLTFYALLVYLKYHELPHDIFLHWAKTETFIDEDGLLQVKLTGDIKTFATKRTMKDIIIFSKRIKTAWAGICELGKMAKQG